MPAARFFADNPYLFSELFCLASLVVAYYFAGPQRRMVLLAGTVTLPFFPLGGLIDPEYWSPVRLAKPGGWWFGIEDPLYLFVLGARAWFVASIAFRSRFAARGDGALFLRRAIPLTAVAFAAYFGLVALGLGFMLPAILVPPPALAGRLWRSVAKVLAGDPAVPPPWRVLRFRHGTFAHTPADCARRLATRNGWSNFFLAGDWTGTGQPATLDGAVQSGHAAAAAALGGWPRSRATAPRRPNR